MTEDKSTSEIRGLIQQKRLSGASDRSIANQFNSSGLPTPDNSSHWTEHLVFALGGPVFEGPPSLPTCAVVIPCHNYGRYLVDCIESAINQTHPATEIVVVLDRCSDDSAQVASKYPVQIITTNASDVYLSSRLGLKSTFSEVVCFLDADDKLSENYLFDGLRAFSDGIGVVTGDAHCFGLDDYIWKTEATDIQNINHVTSAALVRRTALEESGCFERLDFIKLDREDWAVWRVVCSAGWRVAKAPIVHHYRRHDCNSSLSQVGFHWHKRFPELSAKKLAKTIKVGFATPHLVMGGVTTTTLQQIKHAQKCDWVGVYVPDGGKVEGEIARQMPPLMSLEQLAEKSDVIYTWGSVAPQMGLLKSSTNKPVVYGIHFSGPWAREALLHVSEHVDLFWCITARTASVIPEQHRNKARIVRIGCDLSSLHQQRSTEEVREAWGLSHDEIAVGFVGRISWEKNVLAIAEAVATLPSAKLVCCSPQSFDSSNWMKLRVEEILGGRVIWTDSSRDPMPDVYRGIDCLVVASLEEATPVVTLEAWACSCPVVTTPVGIMLELESLYGQLVFRVPHNPSPTELANGIIKSVQDRCIITAKAKEIALYELGSHRMTNQFESILTEAVSLSKI